jgi:hypothetical protein
MKDISPNSEKQAFTFTTYLLRGRLFRSNSFDIMDPTGSIVLRAKPPTIISSDKSIFSSNGDELVACQNKCSLKEAYYSGVFKYEFKDILTSQTMGSLKGISNKGTPEYLNWIILDPQEIQIGHVMQEATHPEFRYGGKPMYDIMTGFIGGEKVFLFRVDINSFRFEMSADFSMDSRGALDRKLGLALACLFASMKRTPPNDT